MCMRAKEVINNLKNEKKWLKAQNINLLSRIEDSGMGIRSEEIDYIRVDVRMLKMNREELKKNYKLKVEKMKKQLRVAYLCLVCFWIMFLFVFFVYLGIWL